MSRREAWLSVLGVFVAALVVRVVAAGVITFPRPEDTAYYVGVARNLVEGRGLVSDALWSYATPPLVIPRPAFEVWLPLPTFLAAGTMTLLGSTSFAAAQWSSILAGSLVPVLAWRLAADVAEERTMPLGRARTLALGTGMGAAVYLPLVLHSVLPDSTMPFALLVLAVCLLAGRVAVDPRGARLLDLRVLTLGALLGLAALTRNEAIWLALAWVWVAGGIAGSVAGWLRLTLAAAIPAAIVFAPWALRDWQVFGSPFPGQALANALSLNGRDIFAWQDTPTLARYLDAGPGTLVSLRVDGLLHNLLNVLLLLGFPISAIGLLALPWQGRGVALSLLTGFSVLTFLVAALVFPVATQWGTFLHAAGAVQVLLLVAALLALDRVIVLVGRRRGWTRPVAWLGPAFVVGSGLLFSAILLVSFGRSGDEIRDRYAAMPAALAAAGVPIDETTGPVITDFPIWFSEETGHPALALPDEDPASILDLAAHFPGTELIVVAVDNGGRWPEIAGTDQVGLSCLQPVLVPDLPEIIAFRITCP